MGFCPQFAFSIPRAGPCASGSFAEPAPVRGLKFVDMQGGTEVVTPFYLVGRAGVGGQGTGTVGPVLARSVWCARSCGALASLGRQTTVPTLNLKSLGFAANFLSGAGRQGALAALEGELAAKPKDACCVFVTRRRARQAPAKLVCNFAPAHTVQHKHITVGATLALMSYISTARAHLSMVASNFCRA